MFSAKIVLELLASYFVCVAGSSQHSDLWHKFHEVVLKHGQWSNGLEERQGQICDPTRRFGDKELPKDEAKGCAVVFISDPGSGFTVKDLPLNQQDNYQNTQHYEAAWNFHGKGLKGDSLPRAPQDIQPVCYLANVSGQVVMGYEEGNGGSLMPCPGSDGAYPFSEQELLADGADLEAMCDMCYH